MSEGYSAAHSAVNGGYVESCEQCEAALPYPKPRGMRYCSDRCRLLAWAKRQATQKPLDWTPPAVALIPLAVPPHDPGRLARTAPVEGEPFEASRIWLLARLRQGPVSTLELRSAPWPASMNPAQRVYELRQRQHDIRTEREGKDYRYALYVEGKRID